MHVLSWILLNRRPPDEARRIFAGDIRLGEEVVGVDPAVNLAIDRAVGEGLLQPAGHRVELTPAGETALARIKESGAFEAERSILAALTGKIRDSQARQALRGVRA